MSYKIFFLAFISLFAMQSAYAQYPDIEANQLSYANKELRRNVEDEILRVQDIFNHYKMDSLAYKQYTSILEGFIQNISGRDDHILEYKKVLNKLKWNETVLPEEMNMLTEGYAKDSLGLQKDKAYFQKLSQCLAFSDYFVYEIKAYFAHKKYQIPENILPAAYKAFTPFVERIVRVEDEIRDFPLKIVIQVYGSAAQDENDLTQAEIYSFFQMTGSSDIGKENGTAFFSMERASTLKDIIEHLIQQKRAGTEAFSRNSLSVEKQMKKGEKLAQEFRSEDTDKNRRIAYVTWAVFPL